MNNCETKNSFLKSATMTMHGQFRRHSSHPAAGMDFAKPAMVKIGGATALPIMLYHQWIHVQEPTQSGATDEIKCSDDDPKVPKWRPTKLSCDDASLHLSR